MHGYARNLLLAASLLAAESAAFASPEGIYLPPAPSGPGGEDVVESASGARCRQSMNNNNGYLDVGVTAGTSRDNDRYAFNYNGDNIQNGVQKQPSSGQALGYARISIPLGHRPARIDCSRLYELEIARMQREIELLKMAAE